MEKSVSHGEMCDCPDACFTNGGKIIDQKTHYTLIDRNRLKLSHKD